jgi:hypothetical protein
MRKPFRSQNRAVTAAFFIAPVVPGVFIPLVGRWTFRRMWRGSWWGSILGGALGGVAIQALVGGRYNFHGVPLLLYGAVGAATGLTFWAVVMLGPEPSQSTARNWVGAFRRRRE